MLPILSANKDKLGTFEFETQELSSGYGIADVVFYNLKPDTSKVSQRTPPIKSADIIRLLNDLGGAEEVISITMLKQRLAGFSNRNEVLTYLLEDGFIQQLEDSYRKVKDYEVGFGEVVAIEAKLKDWRRGLYQAYRYRDYANQSYLALYSPYIHRARKFIGEFEKYNVGLIEVTDTGLEIISEPKREEIRPNIFSATAFENAILVS